MVTAQSRAQEVAEFRQEALVIEEDGTYTLMMHGENDNVRKSPFKRPFNPHVVNGYDDGDPHYV